MEYKQNIFPLAGADGFWYSNLAFYPKFIYNFYKPPWKIDFLVAYKWGGFYMIEIEMENELGLKIFINGVPDIKEIPPDKLESLLAVLEMQISSYYENKKAK